VKYGKIPFNNKYPHLKNEGQEGKPGPVWLRVGGRIGGMRVNGDGEGT
jgi:hypothetical protein